MASVTVSPTSAQVDVGKQVQFAAAARNLSGELLTGIAFTWTVSNPSIASIDANGLVTGNATGSVSVQALSGGKSGSASLTINAILAIVSVAPAELQEGQEATITGMGFSITPTANQVLIGGVLSTVVSATSSELRVIVPQDCRPPGSVSIQVTVGTRTSSAFQHPYRPLPGQFDLETGTPTFLLPPANGCMQFTGVAGEQYLVGIQSTSEVVTGLIPLRIRALGSGQGAAGNLQSPDVTIPRRGRSLAPHRSRVEDLLSRHRDAEGQFRLDERRMMKAAGLTVDAFRALETERRLIPAAVPQKGDLLTIRYPDDSQGNDCRDFTTISAVVRYVSQRGIFVEDTSNSPGGFSDSQYASLGGILDSQIMATLIDYFGQPADLDGNGRVVIVITRNVNEMFATDNKVGFVRLADNAPRSICPSSNQGEYYYSLAPDPAGASGVPLQSEEVLFMEQTLLAHEITHVIQYGRRLNVPGVISLAQLMPPWQAEGQATLAEEVVGFRIRGRATGKNYGFEVISENVTPNWHEGMFIDLFTYFGWNLSNGRIVGAPEQCSFMGLADEGNDGPCVGRMAYGVSWSFLRWLSDVFGPSRGGEQAVHRAIIDNPFADFRTIEQVTGWDKSSLLLGWAASLYVDDRVPGLHPSLYWSSWNLFAIDQGLIEAAKLRPRTAGTSITDENVSVRAGSSAYFLLNGSSTSLRVRSASGGALSPEIQIWAVRLR